MTSIQLSFAPPPAFFEAPKMPAAGPRELPSTPRPVPVAPRAAPPAAGDGQRRARVALDALAAPASNHPMTVYTNDLRRQLTKEKLPVEATGVRVVAMGERTNTDHGPAVARSIAGPIGMARNASVELPAPVSKPSEPPADNRLWAASIGDLPIAASVELGIGKMEGHIRTIGAEVRQLTGDRQTTIATLSQGLDAIGVGTSIADPAIMRGNDALLVKENNALRKTEGLAPLDVTRSADKDEFRDDIIRSVTRAATTGPGKERLDAARASLATDVADARKRGVLMFAASGNAFEGPSTVPGADRSVIAGTPGIIMVGASDIRDPKDTGDDRVAGFSSSGANIAAPGERMPVGAPGGNSGPKPRPVDIDGTSFAAPFTAGVAALMVRANPKITPDKIEEIMLKTARDDVTTTRDGAGYIDPVAAVRAAKKLQ